MITFSYRLRIACSVVLAVCTQTTVRADQRESTAAAGETVQAKSIAATPVSLHVAPIEETFDDTPPVDAPPPLAQRTVASGCCPNCGQSSPAKSSCRTCCRGSLIDWSEYPETIHAMPRPGIFPIPPKGPGYFSLADRLHGECRPAAPKSGYAPFALNAWPFFDADWRYVEEISWRDRTLVEKLKRLHCNDCLMFSTGGEFWTRYHNEDNSRLTPTDNEFTLVHLRQYIDLWYSDFLRVYGEYVWADSFDEDLPAIPPDIDRGDILDLFVDLKLGELAGQPVYVRGGRQELLYGSQRLITPLPWANKRNSFDGVKLFRHGPEWDFDIFWTQFVPPRASEFDTADSDLNLAGIWLTRKPKKGEFRDLYYLMFDSDKNIDIGGVPRAPFETHTLGSRWTGDQNGFLWDAEAAVQFGSKTGADLLAGMATIGFGRRLGSSCLSPTLWAYYDYASGDDDLTAGDAHTFNPIFPFGHYYLGWMDLVGRQNIHDLNAHLYFYPNHWTTVWIQYHHFWLAESRDALYNAGGVPLRFDPTGAAGTNVGDEIDLVVNFRLARYTDILVSYNKLFGGSFLEATAGPGGAVDAETLYLLFTQRW